MDAILLGEISDLINDVNSNINERITDVKSIVDAIHSDVSEIKKATNTNNTALSTGTLSQKISWIGSDLIGTTNNTGGTPSAGTIMAKLNAILNKVNTGVTTTDGCLKSITKFYSSVGVSGVDAGLTQEQLAGLYSMKVNEGIFTRTDDTFGNSGIVYLSNESIDNGSLNATVTTVLHGASVSISLHFDEYNFGKLQAGDDMTDLSVTYFCFS